MYPLKYIPALLVLLVAVVSATTGSTATGPSLTDRLKDACSLQVRAVSFLTTTKVAGTSRNPGNRIMSLPSLTGSLQLRPDMQCETGRLTFLAKPRLTVSRQSWTTDETEKHRRWENDIYFQEWLIRRRFTDNLYLSYGRENLQWGPASLTSLSNPFFSENGKTNPKLEVDSMDFARMVWVVTPSWTISLIANTNEGRAQVPVGGFTQRYAVKADYTGSATYGSLIASVADKSPDQFSGFFDWTVSDGLLLYSEGALQRNPAVRYPQSSPGPLGYDMSDTDASDGHWFSSILAGGSYTLESGPTLTLEYLHYGPGYTDSEARDFFTLVESAARRLQAHPDRSSVASRTLGITANPGPRFLRRNYMMLQYQHNDIGEVLNLTLRWTHNLDDDSNQFNSIGEWFVSDQTQLFAVATVHDGKDQSEFGSIIDYQLMLGMVYYF